MVLDFLKKKNGPFHNRFFYEEFFQEQDKHEKLEVLESVTNKLTQIMREDRPIEQNISEGEAPKGLQNMQRYIGSQGIGMKNLKLNVREKNLLLQKLKEDERQRREDQKTKGSRVKHKTVSTSQKHVIDVIKDHRYNNMFESETVTRNLKEISDKLQPD